MSDTSQDDLNGASVVTRLGAMDSEELIALRDELVALKAMPGWARLMGLVESHKERVQAGTQTAMWSRLATGRSLDDQAPLLTAAGRCRGMDEVGRILETVLSTAAAVERAIGITTEG